MGFYWLTALAVSSLRIPFLLLRCLFPAPCRENQKGSACSLGGVRQAQENSVPVSLLLSQPWPGTSPRKCREPHLPACLWFSPALCPHQPVDKGTHILIGFTAVTGDQLCLFQSRLHLLSDSVHLGSHISPLRTWPPSFIGVLLWDFSSHLPLCLLLPWTRRLDSEPTLSCSC